MQRAFLALFLVALATPVALAQDEFTPGGEDTLVWMEPEKAFNQMLEDTKPGMLYFFSAYKAEFCKAVEKEIIPSKSMARKLKKFVCIKITSDKESELLSRYKVEQGEAAVLFLDCQGKAAAAIKEKPDASAFSSALRKAEKVNKELKKFLGAIEKNFKKGEACLKRRMFLQATQLFQAILKARDGYEEKRGEIKSPYFEKAEKKLEQIKEEGTKLLIKANAAIMKNDFANASVVLAELRAQFCLFPDIMTKVERAEQDLQRRMQQAQQGK